MASSNNRMRYCSLLFNFIIGTACVQFALAEQCETTSSTGKNFVFGFIGYLYNFSDQDVHLHMTSSTNTTTNVRIVVPYINYDEYRIFNNSITVSLSGTILNYGGTPKQSKAVEVIADANISLQAMVTYYSATEGFVVLPTSALDTRYVAAAYTPYSTYMNEILIIGTEPSTNVQISYTINGALISNTTQLMANETYQLSVHHDLSGALITSNKPVAVVSGSVYSQIPVHSGYAETLIEQLVPTKYWGYKYIIPPIYQHTSFIVKLFADENQTEVNYYNGSRPITLLMSQRAVMEIQFSSSPVVILSNKPIQIIQYGMYYERESHRPFMTTAQSMGQFTDSYKFVVPHGRYGFTSTVTITIDKTEVSGLRLNGRSVTTYHLITIAVPDPFNNYVTLFVNLTSGETYNIHHVSSGVNYGASVYGFYGSDAFGFPLGFTLQCNTNQTSSTTTSTTTTPVTSTTPVTPATITTTPVTTPVTPATNPSSNIGSTTTNHPGNQQHVGNGTWCFHCHDMYSLASCEIVTQCSSESQVCFVQRYKQSDSYYLYRSGCMDKHMCGAGNTGAECHECCDGQFCNNHGCGDAGVGGFQDRGPLCFDCAYQIDGQLCHTVQLCASNQVCSIEMHAWGNGLRHTKGCQDKLACASRTDRRVQTRNAPLCSQCCSTDFCNNNCTRNNNPPIIG